MTTTKPKNDWCEFDMEQAQELERLRKENVDLRGRLELQRELSIRRAMIIQAVADRLQDILKLPDSYNLYTAVSGYCQELEGEAKEEVQS